MPPSLPDPAAPAEEPTFVSMEIGPEFQMADIPRQFLGFGVSFDSAGPRYTALRVPLWFVAAAVWFPTALLWRRRRRPVSALSPKTRDGEHLVCARCSPFQQTHTVTRRRG